MNYDALLPTYRQVQAQRVLESVQRIRSREAALGKVIPQDEDLTIGAGRSLSLAVLFLDICSFSNRPSDNQRDQEKVLIALHLFFTEMVRIAEDYGGVVEKNTGDGLMAYFEDGGGIPPETGCKRAVASALTMMDAGSNLVNPVLQLIRIDPIEFRVGIDHGSVTIARLGAAKRFNSIVAIGTAANIASKMLALAKPGEILIGDSVRRRLPFVWWQFAQRLERDTGWIYKGSAAGYPFYRYMGRWNRPVRGMLNA